MGQNRVFPALPRSQTSKTLNSSIPPVPSNPQYIPPKWQKKRAELPPSNKETYTTLKK
jgi:hypothetical protein